MFSATRSVRPCFRLPQYAVCILHTTVFLTYYPFSASAVLWLRET